MDVFTEQVNVTLGDVDGSRRIKPSAFFSYFQHATTLHGDDLGIGAAAVAQVGQGWVLSRFSLEVERRPTLSEALTLTTWPRGFKKLFAIRDYRVTGADGADVARARSGWLVIDIVKRRPLREESLAVPLPRNDGEPDMLAGGIESLPERADMRKAGIIVPAYSDTDFNGHVNNVRYIEWLQNYAPAGTLLDAKKFRIDINYINEVLPGTPLDIFTVADGGFLAVQARRQADNQVIFRAELRAE